ncbi:hypothetical protein FALBO_2344 [Fusarium albosuccineum]|uniref:Uncharacterized protein n=1 Tax=Fusarium albosuccineum TaxID=1237068 RepID=A0A8H4LNC3_9HYPO|nr:hypothetical protein FALBO_2344 [Fusarium albosuccineum]
MGTQSTKRREEHAASMHRLQTPPGAQLTRTMGGLASWLWSRARTASLFYRPPGLQCQLRLQLSHSILEALYLATEAITIAVSVHLDHEAIRRHAWHSRCGTGPADREFPVALWQQL